MSDTDTDTDTDTDDADEWNPEPCSLREGETRDVSGHARRNIEQLRRSADEVDDGELADDLRERADELEREQSGDGDAA